MYVPATPALTKSYASLKQDILNTNKISSVSLGGFSPMAMYNNGGGWKWDGKSDEEDVLITNVASDADYLKTFDIKLQAGRSFSQDPNVDSLNVVINESLAKLMGKAGHVGGQIWRDATQRVTIIGITKNFVYNNLNEVHPAPLMFFNSPSNANYIFMKLNPANDMQATISQLQSIFQKADASQSFDYHFVDKDFEQKFHYQQFIGSLATIFGCLAIFISCLGLFGLASFVAEQRKKEIGVRKVLGATVHGITTLLSKDFLKLVFISCLIAFPAAWWIMHNWLQSYDYRTDLSWWIFAVAGVSALLITLLTVSFQAIKAAVANPVKSLKSE
jgi:putative ABC transport system permease protein